MVSIKDFDSDSDSFLTDHKSLTFNYEGLLRPTISTSCSVVSEHAGKILKFKKVSNDLWWRSACSTAIHRFTSACHTDTPFQPYITSYEPVNLHATTWQSEKERPGSVHRCRKYNAHPGLVQESSTYNQAVRYVSSGLLYPNRHVYMPSIMRHFIFYARNGISYLSNNFNRSFFFLLIMIWKYRDQNAMRKKMTENTVKNRLNGNFLLKSGLNYNWVSFSIHGRI